jgi:hypothetical protein
LQKPHRDVKSYLFSLKFQIYENQNYSFSVVAGRIKVYSEPKKIVPLFLTILEGNRIFSAVNYGLRKLESKMTRSTTLCLAFYSILGLSITSAAQSNEEVQINSAKEFYATLAGEWTGSYSLWLRPDTPAQESEFNGTIKSAVKSNYFLMKYSWKRGDKDHEGLFLFGGNGKDATATWGDSFHSIPEPMHCKGELTDDGGKLIFNGSYSAGEGPTWGWRTEFTRQGPNSLLMEAYNITPDGQEALAVRAEMERVRDK